MSAYLIIQATVTNWDMFSRYTSVVPKLIEQFGGEYVVMDGQPELIEGEHCSASVVVSKWPDKATAQKFWQSTEYKDAKTLRENCGDFHVMLVDGLDSK